MSSTVSRRGQGSEVLVASVRPAVLQVQQPRVSPFSTAWLPAWLPRGPRGQSHHTLCPPLAAFSADHAGAEPEEPSEAYICKTTAQFAKEISHFTEEAGKAGKPQTLTITHVVVGDTVYWSMRSDVHDFNHTETYDPPRRSHHLMVAAHVAADADMHGLQRHHNVTLEFLLEADSECWHAMYGGLQITQISNAVFATLLQEARHLLSECEERPGELMRHMQLRSAIDLAHKEAGRGPLSQGSMSEEEAAYVHINARQRVLHSLRMAIICFRGVKGLRQEPTGMQAATDTSLTHQTGTLALQLGRQTSTADSSEDVATDAGKVLQHSKEQYTGASSQCKAATGDGFRCTRRATRPSGLCWQHAEMGERVKLASTEQQASSDRAAAMIYHASQIDLHQELQQRLKMQFPGQIKYLLYSLERLATHPGAWWNSPGVQDKQHRCRLERCLKEYQRVAFGPGKDKELAQRLRNDVIIPALHPRDVLRAQWGHLSGSKSINERLLMEAMLRKPLEEHHASIELELGLTKHESRSGLTRLQLRSLRVGHETLALTEGNIYFDKATGQVSRTEAAVATLNARQDISLFFAVAGLHTKEPESVKDRERRIDHIVENVELDAERKHWLRS